MDTRTATIEEAHGPDVSSGSVMAWPISLSSLRVGMRLTEPVYDLEGKVLLHASTRVTTHFLDGLRKRGIHVVHVGCPASVRRDQHVRGKRERQLDELLEQLSAERDPRHGPSDRSRTPLAVRDLAAEAALHLERHARASRVAEDVARRCFAGATDLPEEVERTIRDFVKLITVDSDLLPTIVSLQEAKSDYLFVHCVNVSLLSMTIGGHLGLSVDQILELGTGALLQDVGMLRVPESIRQAPRALTPDERIEMERHVLYTLDSLQRLEGLPSVVPFVGYQVHERLDGSGYPRGRSGMFIHQYAKIAAVADVYAAMTHERPYRPAILPYDAVREILLEGSRGELDRTVIRAFLDCVSVFPIGSYVELDNGVLAKVVRANAGYHTRPVVVAVDARGEVGETVIDLLKDTSCRVVRAVPPPVPQRVLAAPRED